MLKSGFGTVVRPSSAVTVGLCGLVHWFGEKLLFDSRPAEDALDEDVVTLASLNVPRATRFVFFTGC